MSFEANAKQQDMQSTDSMLTTIVTVVDESGEPIEGATIEVDGLRPVIRPGALHAKWSVDRGPAPVSQTNSDGKALVRYPKFLTEDMLTGAISFSVTHPNYVAYRTTNYPVDGPNNPIRLQQGAIFRVRGFVEENGSKRIVENIFPMARAIKGQNAYGSSGGWALQKDGWLETTKLPPGGVLIMLACIPKQGQDLFSLTNSVWLQRQGEIAQELELTPGTRVEGKLDDSVPRPIKNATVIAYCFPIQPGVTDPFRKSMRSFAWRDWTDISEDGTFVFESIPKGRVEMIALCDGHRSKSPVKRRPGWPQTFNLAENTVKVELEMEQTATAEIHITNSDGEPIQDAEVYFYPNVRWNDWMSTIFGKKPSRTRDIITRKEEPEYTYKAVKLYTSISDKNGIAVVKNLPSGKNNYSIKHEKYTIPARINVRIRSESIELESGERAVANVVLIEKGTDTLSGGVNQEVK